MGGPGAAACSPPGGRQVMLPPAVLPKLSQRFLSAVNDTFFFLSIPLVRILDHRAVLLSRLQEGLKEHFFYCEVEEK